MPRTPLLLLLGCALSTPPLTAQSPVHGIPVRGAAIYERAFERQCRVLEPAEFEKRNVGEVPDNPGAAVVLHSDLGRKGKRFERLPTQLLDIGTYVACDLSTLGKNRVGLELLQIPPFGALQVGGEIEQKGDGVEHLRLDIRPPPLRKRDKEPANVLTARMLIVRKWDAERGLIDRIENTFTGEMHFTTRSKPDQIKRAGFTLRDDWQLREVVGNRGPKFEARVNDAIRKGAANIEKILAGDLPKSHPAGPDGGGQTRRSGELALITLTLLKAGGTRFDPLIKKTVEELRRRNITDTYSLGVALLMMEACYTPASERDDMLSGRRSTPYPRELTAEDRELVESWVEQLLANHSGSGKDDDMGWHYLAAPDFDNSCSQYAVLGLYAAHLCDVKVERNVWAAAARHFLRVQCTPEDKIRFNLTTHAQVAAGRSRGGTAAATEAAGWAYKGRDDRPTGSMTTAGIGSLTICDTVLRGSARGRPRDVSAGQLRAAIDGGFGWLAAHYDVRQNPGRGQNWRLYYLYGLERVCELNQVAHIQEMDWYFDGATMLLEEQGDNGRWGSEIDTCFGILFLKKAALPAVTGKR